MFTRFSHAKNTPRFWPIYIQGVQSAAIRSINIEADEAQSENSIGRIFVLADRLAAAILLTLSLPVLVLAALTLVALSRRSPLVAHQRVGYGGRSIWVLKLRTMWTGPRGNSSLSFIEYVHASDADCGAPKRARDPRVTSRFAAYCRRLSIDELPQLWHIMRGEMALVGPRPLTRYELNTYYGPDIVKVLTKRPGLSGLWQISGRSRLSYAQRRRLDLFMIRKWSVPLYCRILITTIPRVLTGKDAW